MGSNKVTIKDIAAEAGVSISLVSFVMSNQATGRDTYRVNKDTAKRVLEVAKKHNYRPNTMARSLRSGRTYSIGVIVSDISNKFFADIARCIEDRANHYNYTVLFGSTDENPEKLKALIEVFMNKGIDGLIVVPCAGSQEAIRLAAQSEIPVVLLDRDVPEYDLDCVVLNNARAGEDATQSLIARGCSKIDMVSHALNLSNLAEREEGYTKTMRKSPHTKQFVNIVRIPHDDTSKLKEYIKSTAERGVEGILFATNTLAVAGIKEIYRNGYSIPEDFMIASFDSNDIFDLSLIDVNYVSQPVEKFGREAVDLMMRDIDKGKDRTGKTKISLNSELITTRNQVIECLKDFN